MLYQLCIIQQKIVLTIFVASQGDFISEILNQNGDQVEFPDICDRLTDEKKTILSLKSKMFEKVWIDSFGGERKQYKENFKLNDDKIFYNYTQLPPLDKYQFAKFYKTIDFNRKNEINIDDLESYNQQNDEENNEENNEENIEENNDENNDENDQDKENKQCEQQNQVDYDDIDPDQLFDIVLFGKNRRYINWLQFWVFLCNGNRQIKDENYMIDEEQICQNKQSYPMMPSSYYQQKKRDDQDDYPLAASFVDDINNTNLPFFNIRKDDYPDYQKNQNNCEINKNMEPTDNNRQLNERPRSKPCNPGEPGCWPYDPNKNRQKFYFPPYDVKPWEYLNIVRRPPLSPNRMPTHFGPIDQDDVQIHSQYQQNPKYDHQTHSQSDQNAKYLSVMDLYHKNLKYRKSLIDQ